ncbi:ABC transporter ATP-binding protein [Bowdeniella nasicola]|uniref:ABC-type quaternary amine transporter n=1 Tax=Bowdeniella nasicola TaxID=208480 RepID=A0A1Q5PZT6_9ACTO|nr:ATP-binding cassette domain-containing protein [Bowdeniella nasicola]OKL53047.1 ABC transporter ATP-binding protein [Bowdeniella nasicola]
MIDFDSVTKLYPDGTEAVRDFSLHIPQGSLTALVGSSGSGKTTLLRCINRMVDPTSGAVLINGKDVADRPAVELRRSIGYVMQQSGLLPHRRVIDNAATVLRLRGVDKKTANERAEEVLNTVGIAKEMFRRYPSQLSGGQAQRVGVARALAADPEVLLMDEPFGAVDPIVRAELQAETRRLHQELGTTIVFVTHDIDEAFALADQVVIMKTGGEVAQVGSPAQILANPADDFVAQFVGLDSAKRRLRIEERDGARVVIAEDGRIAGVLDQ